jgi:formamidopyrimidine-DNA glycosylase
VPELPEVETVAAELRLLLGGRRFAGAEILWPRTLATPDPEGLNARLAGAGVVDVGRRGKYLLVALDSGDTLIIHLRMTGRLEVFDAGAPALDGPHVRARFRLDGDRTLTFTDSRKFGRVWLVYDPQDVIGKLGPEPIGAGLTAEALAGRLVRRKTAIKALLLDQTLVAGVGNIYADEALWLAQVHPLRPASSLSPGEVERLLGALEAVLAAAVDARGTTLRDYRPPYSGEGAYQARLRVYQQTGRPCPRCGTSIERIRVTQRSTHFCPNCQPAAD